MKRMALAFAVTLFALGSVSVFGETKSCTPITTLPAKIFFHGVYCLTGNLSTAMTSGNAIEITANNVTLDLNGWKVGGQAGGPTTAAHGIHSAANNITVRNGIVRGFKVGVSLEGQGSRVEDLLVDQSHYLGIYVSGQGVIVRGNQIIDTGTLSDTSVTALIAEGPGSVIENNIISGVTANDTSLEQGIYLKNTANQTTVRANTVSDDVLAHSVSVGMYIAADDVVAVENNVTNFHYGIAFMSGGSGTYAHNVVVNCSTPYSGGTAGSDND